MSLIQLLEALIVVGVLLWLINRFCVDQSLHSGAGNHQVDSEWRCSHCCRAVASECLWTISFIFSNPCRNMKTIIGKTSERRLGRLTSRFIQLKTAEICLRGYFEDQVIVSSRNHPQFERIRSNQFSIGRSCPNCFASSDNGSRTHKSDTRISRECHQPHRPGG